MIRCIPDSTNFKLMTLFVNIHFLKNKKNLKYFFFQINGTKKNLLIGQIPSSSQQFVDPPLFRFP